MVLTGMVVLNGLQEAFKKPEFQQNHDFMRLGYRHSAQLAFLSANVPFHQSHAGRQFDSMGL